MLFKTSIKSKKGFFREIFELCYTLVFTIIIALFITSNIIAITQIKEQSMEPTFKEDDRVIVYKLGYNLGEPKRGDIIILNKYDSKKGLFVNMINDGRDIIDNIAYRFTGIIKKNNLIKRVIGIPGDNVDIRNGLVYINEQVESGYDFNGKTFEDSSFAYPLEIPENKVFVLGDNREKSLDSRGLGLIDYAQVKGKVSFRIWPLSRFGKVE